MSTMINRVLAYVTSHPDSTAREVAAGLGEPDDRSTVRSALNRLCHRIKGPPLLERYRESFVHEYEYRRLP
jgi:hypothetical protein